MESWLKKANRIGTYNRTYRKFRIYCTKEPEIKTSIVDRDGEEWRRTDFIPGWHVAIDKWGCRFEAAYITDLAVKIDIEIFLRSTKH